MSHTTHSAHALPEQCPNCSATVHGPYCAQCGQQTIHEMPTLREFAHEYLHHYVAAEGKLITTIRLLVLKPGQLTVEYLAGRRQRYVKPLSLYLTLSFLFFLLLGWSGMLTPTRMVIVDHQPAARPEQAIAALAASDSDPDAKQLLGVAASVVDKLDHPDTFAAFTENLLHRLPYAVFLLMPVFAALCALVYLNRKQTYGVHLLFTLHLHTFIFLVFMVCLLPGVRSYALCAAPLLFAYLVIALRRVYGGGWWPQLGRALGLAGVYSLTCSTVLGLVTLFSTGVHLQIP